MVYRVFFEAVLGWRNGLAFRLVITGESVKKSKDGKSKDGVYTHIKLKGLSP